MNTSLPGPTILGRQSIAPGDGFQFHPDSVPDCNDRMRFEPNGILVLIGFLKKFLASNNTLDMLRPRKPLSI